MALLPRKKWFTTKKKKNSSQPFCIKWLLNMKSMPWFLITTSTRCVVNHSMNKNWVTWQQLRKWFWVYLPGNICLKVTFQQQKYEQTRMIDSSAVSPLKFMTLVIRTTVERSRYDTLHIIKQETWAICSTKMRSSETEAIVKSGHFTLKVEVMLFLLIIMRYGTCFLSRVASLKKKIPSFTCMDGKKKEIFWVSKGNTSFHLKNGCVPRDMLVWSVMTLGVDLLRQIATDPHGFSRAHSIGNGLFNFPQGAVPFPRYASLKRPSLLS